MCVIIETMLKDQLIVLLEKALESVGLSYNEIQISKPAQEAFTTVIKTIAQFEPVSVGIPIEQMDIVKSYLENIENASLHVIPSDDSWVRDTDIPYILYWWYGCR